MFKKNVLVQICVLGFAATLLVACASDVQKADIASTANPQDEIAKLSADLKTASTKNIDVLAPTYFKLSARALDDAKSDLAKSKKQEVILDDVRTGRGALAKAYSESEGHEAIAPTLFAARQAALTAGAAKHPELESDLRDLDSDTAKASGDLSKASSEKLVGLQERYLALEKRTVVINELGKAQGIVSGAKKDGAAKRAPQTLKGAELALKNGESSVATNVRNPQGYQKAVATANETSGLLLDVMTTIAQNGKNLPETTALQLVGQSRQIKGLKSDLSTTTATGAAAATAAATANALLASDLKAKDRQLDGKNQELNEQTAALAASGQKQEATDQELEAKSGELASKNDELKAQDDQLKARGSELDSANSKVEIQHAIEKARSQFSQNEAEAYQQGDSLLIRLKSVGFASGRSELPESSLAVLAKVSEVAKSLNASGIKVEGHTDTTGTDKQNVAISAARASAVATYFKSNGFDRIDVQSQGYGFQKPIATNKSKEGRAQNRRVDVVITPQHAVKAE